MSGSLFGLFSLPTWRDYLRDASFRGIPFQVEDHRFTGGRNTVTHVFPQAEAVSTEDLGAAPRKYSLTAYVVGDDYMLYRDRLLNACLNQPGPGVLVHPFLGLLNVRCDAVSLAESRMEGGVARVDLGFIEVGGQALFTTEDPRAAANERLRRVLALARGAMGLALGVRDWGAFVRNAFRSALTGLANDLVGSLLGMPGLDVVGIAQGIDAIGSVDITDSTATAAAITAPFEAAGAAAEALPTALATGSAAADTAETSRGESVQPGPDVVATLLRFASYDAGSVPTANAASLAQMNANNAALSALVADAAVVAAAQAFMAAAWPSAQAAEAAWETLSAAILARQDAAAARFDDASLAAWQAMASALRQDFVARLARLPQLASYVAAAPLPSLVVAQRLYAAPARADELVALNAAPHPMFLPAQGRALLA
jgi:prophage DNA circulation protein